MSDLVSIFTKSGINIEQVNTKNIDRTFTGFEIEADIENIDHLNKIMQKVRSKKFTSSCVRMINEK